MATDDLSRALLEHAVRTRAREMLLDDLARKFGEADRFKELIPALRRLENEGKGRFIIGRKGRPSRFVLAHNVRASQGHRTTEPDADVGSSVVMKTLPVPLRAGVTARIIVPADMTLAEANLIAQTLEWIATHGDE